MSERIDIVHVENNIAREVVLSEGVDERKVVLVPQGVNLRAFRPPHSFGERTRAKEMLGVPPDSVCIGLFQKDGDGWEAGDDPKLVKGPDIFIDAVVRLAERRSVFVLIPGPARGYVRKGLEGCGIPYRADGWVPSLLPYYHALDLYMIPARDEGGPAALLEAMATGVPVVSTRVGMAPDLIRHGENGFLVDVEDAAGLAAFAARLAAGPALREQFAEAGLQTIQAYDWPLVARQYAERLYLPLLER